MVCGWANGPGLKYEYCVALLAGPGHTFHGPGLIIQFAAGPGVHQGLGPNFRALVCISPSNDLFFTSILP